GHITMRALTYGLLVISFILSPSLVTAQEGKPFQSCFVNCDLGDKRVCISEDSSRERWKSEGDKRIVSRLRAEAVAQCRRASSQPGTCQIRKCRAAFL
ncbi:MAG: hypothetical protein AAGF82_23030, partial [Pseudomonadota bacterium]